MKKLACVFSVLALVACSYEAVDLRTDRPEESKKGLISVSVEYESVRTKALTDYTTELDEEKAVKKVRVFVFDKSTGVLDAYNETASVADGYTFKVNAGVKNVYAVINGPDLDDVRTETQFLQTLDDLTETDIDSDGLTMVGKEECNVAADALAEPVIIVRRMVARVVVQSISCSIPPQYGTMIVNAIYLGNAHSCQAISGTVSNLVNPNGYADTAKTRPIGKDGVRGACTGYMYNATNIPLTSGGYTTIKQYMYCHPSTSDTVTCVYLLVSIGGNQYYYRAPLYKGLVANTTTSLEIDIANLGSPLPPDGDMQKGEIKATVTVSGWDAGEKYEVEF